ncbi:MAG: [Fe-Fe] hydrogenase large subunit C-terminal domain-containing protein [Anaeromassilibacillus sp.]
MGEEFGYPIGTNVQGKMATLRRIGFDKVFDTNFSADLTIMEEAHEFWSCAERRCASAHHLCSRAGSNTVSTISRYDRELIPAQIPAATVPLQNSTTLKRWDWIRRISFQFPSCRTAKKFEIQRPDDANGVPDVIYS